MYGVLGASVSGLIITNLLVKMPEENIPESHPNQYDEQSEGGGLLEDDYFLDDDETTGDHPMPVVFSTYHLTSGEFKSLERRNVISIGKNDPMFYWRNTRQDSNDLEEDDNDVSFTWEDATNQVDIDEGSTLGYDTTVNAATGGNQLIKKIETSEIAKKFRDYGVYPVDESIYGISSKYGPRIDPISGKEEVFHTGLDIWSTSINGANIYAILPGAVSEVNYNEAGFGHHVIIDHGNFRTLYAHMGETPNVEVGDVVSAGDKIGIVGTTGRSTGPHLHLEVDVGGVKIDPEPFMSIVGQPNNRNKPKKEYVQAVTNEESDKDENEEEKETEDNN